MDTMSNELVGEAVAVTDPEPVTVEFSTENVVSVGAGTPSTEYVPSRPETPVPATAYREPTIGVNGGVSTSNVKVITSVLGLAYAVTVKAVPPLLLDMVNVGGAPGPH